jgi:CBS domain-containing protein
MKSEGMLPTSKKTIGGVLLWLTIGLVSTAYVTLAYNPTTALLGIVNSPARIAFYYQFSVLITLPIALFGVYDISRHEMFRAPPGRYVPGRHYSIFSPYYLAAMGIVAALYAAGGLFGAVTNFDIVAAVTAFAAAMFPPIVPLVAIIVGGFIRFAITGISFMNPAAVPAFIVLDASRWALAGYLIFRFVRMSGSGLLSYAKWIALIPLVLVIHASYTVFQYFQMGPWESFVGNVGYMVFWWPTSAISIVVGLIVAEAAYRSATRRSRMGSMASSESKQS